MKRSRTLSFAAAALLATVAASPALAVDVDTLWSKNCQTCHGKDAKGDTKAGKQKEVKDLTDPAVRAKFDRGRMIKSVTEGIKDEKTGKDRMKPFGEKLSAEEIAALVDWVIALK